MHDYKGVTRDRHWFQVGLGFFIPHQIFDFNHFLKLQKTKESFHIRCFYFKQT